MEEMQQLSDDGQRVLRMSVCVQDVVCLFRMLQRCTTVEEMQQLSEDGQRVLQSVEDSAKPVVAAIMGSCFGGGLEVGLLVTPSYPSGAWG